MGDDKKPKRASDDLFGQVQKAINNVSDDWFGQVQKALSKTLTRFVPALFLIFGIGALFGALVAGAQHSWLLLIPFVLALLSYYSRDFALVGLGIFVFLFFI
ncbi:MAG: hypothetical protein Q7R70_06670 [Candidatus Diapherotrites archaeon]|nr:hypothetical protein [Candidatus Diapherotrites archaeon]